MSKIIIINLLTNELSFLCAIYGDVTFIELKNSSFGQSYFTYDLLPFSVPHLCVALFIKYVTVTAA
jgi:hypothetical protein